MVKQRTTTAVLSLLALAFISAGVSGAERSRHFPLTSADGLLLENVSAQAAALDDKKGIRVVMSDDALARVRGMSAAERQRASETGQFPEQMAIIDGSNSAMASSKSRSQANLSPACSKGLAGS